MQPVIAIWDLETSPWQGWCYGKLHEPIVVATTQDSQILSCAIRIHGEKKTKYYAQNLIKGYKKGKIDDRQLVIDICEALKDVDYIVGHNGDNFDLKMLKERILFHRLPPLKDIHTFDTKKMFKGITNHQSNKLDDVSQFLGHGHKVEHMGVRLFLRCMEGDEKAWNMNRKYNIHDVDLTYKDFLDIIPYAKLTNNQKAFSYGLQCDNATCLSLNTQRRGRARVTGGWKIRYQCQKCGKWCLSTKAQYKAIEHE